MLIHISIGLLNIKKAYESLLQARIAKKIKAWSNIGIPLEVYASDKKFKNLFLDI
jgi:hypothetical protein